ADERRARLERKRDVARVEPAQELVAPRQERIDPGRERVLVAADVRDAKRAAPAVVAERLERSLAPGALIRPPVKQQRGDAVVPVREDVGFDGDRLADDALDRESPAVDLGRDPFDNGAAAAVDGAVVDAHSSASAGRKSRTASGGSVNARE